METPLFKILSVIDCTVNFLLYVLSLGHIRWKCYLALDYLADKEVKRISLEKNKLLLNRLNKMKEAEKLLEETKKKALELAESKEENGEDE